MIFFVFKKIKKYLSIKEIFFRNDYYQKLGVRMQYKKKYLEWLTDDYFDASTKKELQELDDENQIEDRFYKDLEFGTGGLRGIIGAGTNRINKYTVVKATQGLANYIIKQNGQERGVAIAYDSRYLSQEFSEEVALCLNANNIKTFLFESLRPTPELSFAVRELNCIAGIVITASHNPKEYNGYKVYWADGGQITNPRDKEIINEVNLVSSYQNIKTITKQDAIKADLFHIIGEKIDFLYYKELKKLVINPAEIKKAQNLKIVYSPLHGTGTVPVKYMLKELGFAHIYIVEEQAYPDHQFSTVKVPNPESSEAFEMALNLAKAKDADIVLATDPDADRLGLYVKDSSSGQYKRFTGNMSALLIADYLLSQTKEKNKLPNNGILLTTIVSSKMGKKIANNHNINYLETLTGFKYIGELINKFEQTKQYTYIFGYEESYGCLVGTHARDKDGIAAVILLSEIAAYYKNRNMTLYDQMNVLYDRYGYFKEDQFSFTLDGAEGVKKINTILSNFRNSPLKNIGDFNVSSINDYQNEVMTDIKTGNVTRTELPKSNVLYYKLEEDNWFCIRPSGTEPKLKIYMGVKGNSDHESMEKLHSLKSSLLNLCNNYVENS